MRGKLTFTASVKLGALAGLVLALVVLNGCSCKEYEGQILQLDAQIGDLQQQLVEKDKAIAECEQIAAELRENLQKAKAENAVLLEQEEEVVYVTVEEQLPFYPGQTLVWETMLPTLDAIAATIREHPGWDVMVAGHTDNQIVGEEFQEQWPSNWELGAYRSAAVVRYMIAQFDLPPERFAVISYGQYRPIASNDTAEGRAQNRRVTFMLHKPAELE